MIQFVLDTNILIGHVSGQFPLKIPIGQTAISSLSIFEALCLLGLSEHEEFSLTRLLSQCAPIAVSDKIARHAAALARNRSVGSIDLLIAATALELGVPIVTKNVKDFRRIPGLRVLKEMP